MSDLLMCFMDKHVPLETEEESTFLGSDHSPTASGLH